MEWMRPAERKRRMEQKIGGRSKNRERQIGVKDITWRRRSRQKRAKQSKRGEDNRVK